MDLITLIKQLNTSSSTENIQVWKVHPSHLNTKQRDKLSIIHFLNLQERGLDPLSQYLN